MPLLLNMDYYIQRKLQILKQQNSEYRKTTLIAKKGCLPFGLMLLLTLLLLCTLMPLLRTHCFSCFNIKMGYHTRSILAFGVQVCSIFFSVTDHQTEERKTRLVKKIEGTLLPMYLLKCATNSCLFMFFISSSSFS